tara:strand:+ start:577 stop:1290 length:714 start_codon:yes stop_codon:yes gene_type:complete
MSTDEPGKREQAKAERRSRIVHAARDLIRETGDTNLSMRMIAKRADVSLATPYNLFGSKHAVVLAVFEDERDFTERFSKIKAENAIERIFEAHALATSYFTEDPDFYRPLWKVLLDAQGVNDTGLATPERLERNSKAWEALIDDAQNEGLLDPAFPADMLERTLSFFANGVMLSWSMGTLETHRLLPSAALGYALALRGAATAKGMKILIGKIQKLQSMLEEPNELQVPVKAMSARN